MRSRLSSKLSNFGWNSHKAATRAQKLVVELDRKGAEWLRRDDTVKEGKEHGHRGQGNRHRHGHGHGHRHRSRHQHTSSLIGNINDKPRDFKSFVAVIVRSKYFTNFLLFIIFLNCIMIAIQASLPSDDQTWSDFIDSTFLSIYTVEFILKIYAAPKLYWRDPYNRFDFIILLTSWVQWLLALVGLNLGSLMILRVFRSLRALRSFRTISSIRRLQIIVNALLRTLRKNVIDVVACLVCMMFLFAMMGYFLFGADDYKQDYEHWGTLGNAFMTLMLYVTASNWNDAQDRLTSLGFVGSEWFSVIFMFIGSFIITNLFIGVLCQNIDEATEADRAGQIRIRLEAQRVKKDMLREKQKYDMNQLLAKGDITNNNMQKLLESLAGTLRHDEVVPMTHLACNLTWFETFMVTLHYHENTLYRCQQTHFNIANTLAEILDRRLKAKAARYP